MKKKRIWAALLLGFALIFSLSACGGNNEESHAGNSGSETVASGVESEEAKVSKITIKTNPEKTEYWVGDTFSVEGGVISVTYKDKSTEDIPMTHGKVKIAAVSMANPATSKTVKVTFGGKSATFTIKIKDVGGSVTFDQNYAEAAKTTEKYEKNMPIAQPAPPVRSGYTFDKWYTDAACTAAYDFDKISGGDLTLYASWKQNGASYVNFTYDLNYYGIAAQTYTQIVKSGEKSRTLAFTPTREEFSFDGWFTDAACSAGNAYTQSAVSADSTVYAKWTKTKTGSSVYKFEAENVDMSNQEGPGLSGSAGGAAMVVPTTNEGVSGKVVSYLYKNGLHVDFALACSEDATVTLKVYVASEFTFNLNSGMYKIKLTNSAAREEELDYPAVELVKGAAVTCVTINNVPLKEGANVISLVTANSDNPAGEGAGTYQGTAPMIDCITVETDAVVTWDGTKGLPKQN